MTITEAMRRQAAMDVICEREGMRCFWCERPVRRLHLRRGPFPRDMATMDHIVPQSAGGSNRIDNLVLACWSCNNDRGSIPADVWLKVKRGELELRAIG